MEQLINFLWWALAHPDEVLLIVTAVTGIITWIGRLRVAKAADRLAMVREAAATGAGRIMLAMSQMPVGANRKQLVEQLLRQEAAGIFAEFSTGAATAVKIGATPEKLEAMLKGMLGQAVGVDVTAARSDALRPLGSAVGDGMDEQARTLAKSVGVGLMSFAKRESSQ